MNQSCTMHVCSFLFFVPISRCSLFVPYSKYIKSNNTLRRVQLSLENTQFFNFKMQLILGSNWLPVPSDKRADNTVFFEAEEGVFLSTKSDDHRTDTPDIVHCASFKNTDKLLEIYRQRYSGQGMEMLEVKTGFTPEGLHFVSAVGLEALESKPTAFFGSLTIFIGNQASVTDDSSIELLLWSQEDKMDAGIREKCADIKGVETDPYSRVYDDAFVFHALSRLRRALDSIPSQVALSIYSKRLKQKHLNPELARQSFQMK